MALVGIVGLPGSGKTKHLNHGRYDGWEQFDDIGKNWCVNEATLRRLLRRRLNIVCTDIIFCIEQIRFDFGKRIDHKIDWVFFENNAQQCEQNCKHRYETETTRDLSMELGNIRRLTRDYHPPSNALRVGQAKT